MKLATHNSLSYSGLKNWWLYPFYWMGLCQTKSLEKQYSLGVKLFDIRLNSRIDSKIETSHGPLIFKKDTEEALNFLNEKGDVWVRIILEQNWEMKDQEIRDQKFREKCEYLENKYTKIKFCNGRRKYDWKELYEFKQPEPKLLELYSSTTSLFKSDSKFLRKIDDLCPFLYAFLNNKRILKDNLDKDTHDFLMIDFL